MHAPWTVCATWEEISFLSFGHLVTFINNVDRFIHIILLSGVFEC